MTTNYPSGPTGPDNIPPDRDADAAWGCVWWWWIVILIIILIFWFGGWGWGNYGGWWFRSRPANQPAGPARMTTAPRPGSGDATMPPSHGVIRLEGPQSPSSLAQITLELPRPW